MDSVVEKCRQMGFGKSVIAQLVAMYSAVGGEVMYAENSKNGSVIEGEAAEHVVHGTRRNEIVRVELNVSHCPLPWTTCEREDGWWEIDHACSGGLDCRLSKEDADFIVRACNSHDNLLKACKLLLTCSLPWDVSGSAMVDKARAAIAKAEERGN